MSVSSSLRIYFLGSLRIERGAQPLHLPRRKVELLLAYLALHPEPHSREKLAALLWGDAPDAAARKSLRTALPVLRHELPTDLLLITPQTVQLNPEAEVWIDVRELEQQVQALRRGAIANPFEVRTDLYRGDLLADFYEDWLLPLRAHYGQLYRDMLLQLIQQHRAHSNYEQAINCFCQSKSRPFDGRK